MTESKSGCLPETVCVRHSFGRISCVLLNSGAILLLVLSSIYAFGVRNRIMASAVCLIYYLCMLAVSSVLTIRYTVSTLRTEFRFDLRDRYLFLRRTSAQSEYCYYDPADFDKRLILKLCSIRRRYGPPFCTFLLTFLSKAFLTLSFGNLLVGKYSEFLITNLLRYGSFAEVVFLLPVAMTSALFLWTGIFSECLSYLLSSCAFARSEYR